VDFLKELNKNQRESVVHISGPSLVIAGAGSGKTRVLTYKIAYILSQGFHPSEVLALTFTNKAAREMRLRIEHLMGKEKAQGLWMGTFHSLFARILRTEAEHIGYTKAFTIYDAADAKNLTKSVIKEMNLDDENYKPARMYSRISMAKNNLVTADAYSQNETFITEDRQAKCPEFQNIYRKYCQRCKQANVMDFDDLLLNTNILFRSFPNILEKYAKKFRFVLVDEYQDTNFSQYLIVKKLTEKHRLLSVVGDDAQSIYSFRGAKIENILNFKNDYPDYQLFRLEQNYRSTKNIVNAANSLIDKNKGQIKKTVFSTNETGSKIGIEKLNTDHEEGFFIARSIRDALMQYHNNYSDYAILYRTNAQSRILEESLRKMNIPYRVYGGLSFYQRKEVKDVIAYLRLIINPIDEEALRRIINFPSRKIGDTTLTKLFSYSEQHNVPVWKLISNVSKFALEINSGTAGRLIAFSELIVAMAGQAELLNAADLIEWVLQQTGIKYELNKDLSPQGISRIENVQELVSAAQSFVEDRLNEDIEQGVGIADYLESISLLTDQDTDNKDDNNKVTLMTIHAAKGLEFSHVFVAGMEEMLFPGAMSIDSPKAIEEERRLFYVAITRAKSILTLTYCESRFKYGSVTYQKPSRFLSEIDSAFVEWEEMTTLDPDKQEIFENRPFQSLNNSFTDEKVHKTIVQKRISKPTKLLQKDKELYENSSELSKDEIIPGIHVLHAIYGKGKVISLEGSGDSKISIVFFENVGQKKMMLKFAKFRKL
jgi:DNA helicase-2/ATP-dependent DNA helicase PcrA